MSRATPAQSPGRSVGTRVSRGLGVSLLGQVVTRLGVFASGVVLARLLTPEDFGVFAVALTAATVVMAINELGVIPAIVRWRGDLAAACATGATLALGMSAVLWVGAVVTAPALAAAVDAPEAVTVIRVLTATVLVDGAIAVPLALLARELRQGAQVVAEVAGMVVMVALSVGLAAAGGGAAGMAWGRLAGAVVTGVLFVRAAPWPASLGWDPAIARELLGFGLPIAVSALLLEGVLTVDYLVVGRISGVAALGVYLLAFNLSSWPVSTISMAVARVSFAGFALLSHDRERLTSGFVHAITVALIVVVPMVVVLVVVAPDLVRTVYGARWLDAVAPLRWLLVLGGLRVLYELAGELVAVAGQPRVVTRTRAVWLVTLVPLLAVGAAADGLRGVAVAHVVVAAGLVGPLLLRDLHRVGMPLGALARAAARPALAAVPAAVAGLAGARLAPPGLVALAVAGAAGCAVYAVGVAPGNASLRRVAGQLRARGSAG